MIDGSHLPVKFDVLYTSQQRLEAPIVLTSATRHETLIGCQERADAPKYCCWKGHDPS